MKEYDEIAAVNKKNGDFHSADEFLSGFKKTDRLHPVISLCVYYGESEWDGPFSLKDMLEIPEKIESLVSDYRMNLVQVRSSGELCFSDPDVNMVFDVSRLIYARDYTKINEVYRDHNIPADLGLVIGAITESQKLIDHALESEQKGGQINMCNALEELRQEGVEEGRQEGRQEIKSHDSGQLRPIDLLVFQLIAPDRFRSSGSPANENRKNQRNRRQRIYQEGQMPIDISQITCQHSSQHQREIIDRRTVTQLPYAVVSRKVIHDISRR